jgi:hypothetical protein
LDETFEIFKNFKSEVKNQKEMKIKIFLKVENIFFLNFLHYVNNIELYTKYLHFIPNTMVWLKENNMTFVDMVNPIF